MGYVRPTQLPDTKLADARALAPYLRKEDRDEIMAAVGLTPLQALPLCAAVSDPCWSMIGDDGAIIGMFGVAPTHDELSGAVWMLAADALTQPRHAFQFLRQCRQWVDEMQARFPLLYNFVDARNTVHIRWLRWCGFTFINKHPEWGHEKRPFFEFVRIQPCASLSSPQPASASGPA